MSQRVLQVTIMTKSNKQTQRQVTKKHTLRSSKSLEITVSETEKELALIRTIFSLDSDSQEDQNKKNNKKKVRTSEVTDQDNHIEDRALHTLYLRTQIQQLPLAINKT